MTTVPYTFGNESSPIPLSQLDANFAVTPNYANTAGNVTNAAQPVITSVGTLVALSVTGNINSGNLRTTGLVSVTGNISGGNVLTLGLISAFGSVTGGNLLTAGLVSATGNITGGNVTTGTVSASGNITGANVTTAGRISATGNILAQGIISATGNIVTAGLFVGNFQGNITGNLAVNGSNTQVLFNSNGNVGAAGGLTYNSGSNTLGILGVVSAQGNIYGGNLSINGTTQLVGVATAPTAPTGTANNQVATTVFVTNQINQYANSVDITGGNVAVNNVTATNVTANTVLINDWTIQEISNTLYFQFSGSNVAKLDSDGNFTTIGNVTGFGVV
jgi:hypothetical protein